MLAGSCVQLEPKLCRSMPEPILYLPVGAWENAGVMNRLEWRAAICRRFRPTPKRGKSKGTSHSQ